jgi:hypothetical protein
MNPIARLMKRCIKTPLKYALPLLCIGVLVLSASISGCTSSTRPTATATPVATSNPTATPSATAGFDPLLAKIATVLKPQYGSMVSTRAKNENVSFDGVYVSIENGSTITTVEIRNEGSTENASRTFSVLSTPTAGADVKDPTKVTLFGETAVTTALGHQPTTVKDVYVRGVGDYQGVDNEYIQYDQIFIDTLVTPST